MARPQLSFFTLSVIGILVDAVSSSKCSTTTIGCSSGCWFDGYRCVPVGPGYYSPRDDNEKFACEKGTFSDEDIAAICSLCPPGSFNGLTGQSFCMLCPTAFYQDQYGKYFCSSCTPGYGGQGSNSFNVNTYTNQKICELEEPSTPTPRPSFVPSVFPSKISPSISLTSQPNAMVTKEPSSQPSYSPSGSPTIQQPSSVPSSQTHQQEHLEFITPRYDDDYSFFNTEIDDSSSKRGIFGIILVIMAALCIMGTFVIYFWHQPVALNLDEHGNSDVSGNTPETTHVIQEPEDQGNEKDLDGEIHYVDAIIEPEGKKSTNQEHKTAWAVVVHKVGETKSQGHADSSYCSEMEDTRQV